MIAISKYNKQHPLRVFEAFAGYGSQSLAFKYIQENHPEFDFKVVGYSEIEPSAIQAYRLLHGWDIPNFGDVTRIDWNEVPDFDFISWSSPCQDFSNAGLRKGGEEGSGTRSSLIFQEKRMLAVKKPKYVMLENVKGLLSEKMRKYFFQYLRDLDSFGYTSFYKVLNSKDYGIPQNRERIFVISILRTEDDPNPEYHFPSPIKLETTVEDMLEDNVSPEYFMSQQLLEKYLSKADINESIKKLYQEDKIPKTADGCSPTITSSFGAGISIANLLCVDHFPKGGGIDNQKVTSRKLLINSDIDGLSRTIRSSYYKTSLANYLAPTGSCANAILIIKKL